MSDAELRKKLLDMSVQYDDLNLRYKVMRDDNLELRTYIATLETHLRQVRTAYNALLRDR